jgi:hydrogenase expression/formation protein HypE
LLSGSIGEHGIAIIAQREGLEFESQVRSDSAPLHGLVAAMLAATPGRDSIRCMRDPTRGGLSSALNEIAAQSQVGMLLEEEKVPVREAVKGACELLGFDPFYVANEGKLVAIVEARAAEQILAAMRAHPLGRQAQVIGTVTAAPAGMVSLRTALGTMRIVDMLSGDQLPRIC